MYSTSGNDSLGNPLVQGDDNAEEYLQGVSFEEEEDYGVAKEGFVILEPTRVDCFPTKAAKEGHDFE